MWDLPARSGAITELAEDLVVDAMGRGACTPAFLDNYGYGRPPEQRSIEGVTYANQLLRLPSGMITERR